MLRRFPKIMTALLVLCLLIPAVTPAMAMSVSAKVNTSTKVYKKASSSSASVGLKKGTTVTIKKISGSWAKVSKNGKTGYIPLKYLTTRTRYTAYISKKTYVYKSASSSSTRKAVSVNTKVYVVGKSGGYYRVQNASGSRTGYVKTSCVSRKKVSTAKSSSSSSSSTSWKNKVIKMNWYNGGSRVLKRGSYAYIYDVKTGVKIRIKRMGGVSHADVEPASKADTAKLKRIGGGKFSWASRPVILMTGGKYIASAINTMPHGRQTITNNNYDGQFCLHLSGSKTHGSNSVNSSHQASINRAYNWAH